MNLGVCLACGQFVDRDKRLTCTKSKCLGRVVAVSPSGWRLSAQDRRYLKMLRISGE